MKKILISVVLCLVLVSCVGAYSIKYSNPTYQDGTSINWQEHESLVKINCDKNEWNNNFEEYRSGILPKDDMKNYVRSCKW